ncbi:granulocyte colony-stimulating factor receptor-like isoform X2 [Hemicordylus capensis]|uniref:granulocyte colony-stimulating factor receptor-like isoform X2 n=1 Tax=Hemicordylus capensis TaxID=884348 RepID=UPI002302C3AE|nr:granulocyte colony-stimulating factor receptor-like isoform X2 [Hemicordylus capensis]
MRLTLVWIPALLMGISCSATPRSLKIEYCISYWAKNITCFWDPGLETYPWTTYTLHITEQAGHCRRDFGQPWRCVALQGQRSCGIPVENLFAFFKIKLTAGWQFGQASSSEECVHGMSIVKLSPPQLTTITANNSHCFQLEWHLPGKELVSASEARYEIRYHDLAEMSWTQVNFTADENEATFANICGVAPFTNYSVCLRAKYLHNSSFQSGREPFWSDWSPEGFVRTQPAVPSSGPALWRKLGLPGANGDREVVLMWKPLKPKEANGEILAYSLYSQSKGQSAVPQCLTQDLQCRLFLPAEEEVNFFLTATNSVAPPSPLPVLVSSAGDHSLLLQWSRLSFPRMSYVFEWRRLPRKLDNDICWDFQRGNIDHVIITEAIEPGYLYSLKIFALIDGNVWALGSASAYSKQIAPFRAPALYPVRVWKSQVEVQWEKIPLEEQGGVIRNYTLCYEEEGKDNPSTLVLDSSVHHYLIEGLAPGSVVRVSIMVTNEGGSTKGPDLPIRTRNHDYGEAELWLSVLLVGFLFLAGALACLFKQRLLQNSLWPQIPDPAKSNLAVWIPPKMCPDFSSCGPEKGSQGYLGLTMGGVLRVLPSRQKEEEQKLFLGHTWLLEVANGSHKYPLPTPALGNGPTPQENRRLLQKHTVSWNRVEYSRVVVIQKESGLKEQWSGFHNLWSLSRHQDLVRSCSGPRFSQGVWLQNLTYEALLDVSLCNRVLESTREFPLLLGLVAVDGEHHPADSPRRTPQERN